MDLILSECDANLGFPPRLFSAWDRLTYLKLPRPSWIRDAPPDTEPLQLLFDGYLELLESGSVTWGYVVQTNDLLYRPGGDNYPATLIYFRDPDRWPGPEPLAEIAHQVLELKGTQPEDPEEIEVVDHLNDPTDRAFGLPVPRSLNLPADCLIATTYIARKHLPVPILLNPLLPTVVGDGTPTLVAPLPSRFWSAEFVSTWMAGDDPEPDADLPM